MITLEHIFDRIQAELELRSYCPIIMKFFNEKNDFIDITFNEFEDDYLSLFSIATLISKAFSAVEFICMYQGQFANSLGVSDVVFVILDRKVMAYPLCSLEDSITIDFSRDLCNDGGVLVKNNWNLIFDSINDMDKLDAKLDLRDINIELVENSYMIIDYERKVLDG